MQGTSLPFWTAGQMQEASHKRPMGLETMGAPTASKEGGGSRKEVLRLRKKKEREELSWLFARLEELAPHVEMKKVKPGYRSGALLGRTKEEILEDAVHCVRSRLNPTVKVPYRQCFERTAGLIVLHLEDSAVVHASKEFQTVGSWLCPEGLAGYFFRPLLHPDDAGRFQEFSNEVCEATTGDGNTWIGKAIKVRMLRRPALQDSIRTPEWLLVYTKPIKMTLVDVLKDAGEVSGVFVVDFGSREAAIPKPSVQASHIRNLIDVGWGSGKYQLVWDPMTRDMGEIMAGWMWGWDKRHPRSKFSLRSLFVSAVRMSSWALFNSGAAWMEGGWRWRLDSATDTIELGRDTKFYRGQTQVLHSLAVTNLGRNAVSASPHDETVDVAEISFLTLEAELPLENRLRMWLLTRHTSMDGRALHPQACSMTFTQRDVEVVIYPPWSTSGYAQTCRCTGTVIGDEGGDDNLVKQMKALSSQESSDERLKWMNDKSIMVLARSPAGISRLHSGSSTERAAEATESSSDGASPEPFTIS